MNIYLQSKKTDVTVSIFWKFRGCGKAFMRQDDDLAYSV